MSYHGHRSTPPRSILVIFGGMLAWAGMCGGVLITAPQYHMALSTQDEPVEMTWHELVENGLVDGNSYIRLIDVELDDSGQMDVFDEMLAGFDPEAAPDGQQEALMEAANAMRIGDFAGAMLQPMKVYPFEEDPSDVPPHIVVPAGLTNYAFNEIAETGTLTGRFTFTDSNGFQAEFAKAFMDQAADAVEAELNEARDEAGLENDVLGDGELEAEGIEEALDEPMPEEEAGGARWVYEPMGAHMTLADARQWFWLSFLAVAVGMVICGAGGPSLVCCIFFQGPSILSIFGYPMRYGRATRNTRIVYACAGLGLIYFGVKKLVFEGRFGHVDGDLALVMLGFASSSFGTAALLGSITSTVAQRLNVSLEPKTTKKVPERKINFTEACSLAPPEDDRPLPYVEPSLISVPSLNVPESMRTVADSLQTLGFGPPESVAWAEGEEASRVERGTLIQLGCQEMVVADVEQLEGCMQSRLVSVLHDGMVIITLSANMRSEKSMRFGTSGLYCVSDSEDPVEMLAGHLEQTISMAEKRDTTVVAVGSHEPNDVALFARRVLADIRTQYGEANHEVGSYRYGRFGYPIGPVEKLEAESDVAAPIQLQTPTGHPVSYSE